MKRKLYKGTNCYVVDGELNPTNLEISLDKDRELELGDAFIWNEDLSKHYHVRYTVVGFNSIFPLLIENE